MNPYFWQKIQKEQVLLDYSCTIVIEKVLWEKSPSPILGFFWAIDTSILYFI